MIEKSGVKNSRVGKFMVEKSGVERSGVEAWGWTVRGWNVLQPLPAISPSNKFAIEIGSALIPTFDENNKHNISRHFIIVSHTIDNSDYFSSSDVCIKLRKVTWFRDNTFQTFRYKEEYKG